MIPVLYESSEQNFTTLGLGALNDAISCNVHTVLQGMFELEMTYPVSGKRYKELKVSRIIKAVAERGGSAQLFDIYAITKPLNGVITVYASHVSGRKQFIPIMPCTAIGVNGAFQQVWASAAENNPFTYWTDKNTGGNFSLKNPVSLGQALGGMEGSILDTFGGEYEFDNFTIRLWNHRGQDNGVSLRYGKNITDIEQEESIASTITGICPFWADEEGNTVTLSENTVDSDKAANFPFKRTVVMDFSSAFEEQPTEAQLRSYTQSYITSNNIGIPSVGIDVSYENLADYDEFKDTALLEQVRLGDTVHVYFEPLDITATARVTETEYNVLLDKYSKVHIGSIKASLSSTINSITEDVTKSIGEVSTSLERAFEAALQAFSGIEGGNIVIRRNVVTGKPYELLAMDTDDVTTATNVVRLNMAGIGVSTNGINGPYTAAITGAGIVATAITTGVLNATLMRAGILQSNEGGANPNFYLDLDNGVLKGNFSELSISGSNAATSQTISDAMDTFINGQYASDLQDLQDQIDGQIETYFDNYIPTLNNAPANAWTTTAAKDNHLGDLFYVVDNPDHSGETYRFVKVNNVYKWSLVEDSAVAAAIAEAQNAAALAGVKKRVFTTTPTTPYDVGDLWVNGTDFWYCITAKATGSYTASHWTLATNYIDTSDANGLINTYDQALNQSAVFNKLTNNGQTQGIYLQNNKLYVNAEYIGTGTLSADRIGAKSITAGKLNVTDLYAIGATIGGWSISASQLSKTTTIDGVDYRAAVNAPSSPGQSAGAFLLAKTVNGTTTYPFIVNYNGHITATDATIRGSITATSLTLESGVTIPYSKVSGTPNLSVYIAKDGTIGSTPAEGATGFKVSSAGLLQASNAVIYGSLYSSYGRIAGWSIDSAGFTKTATVDNVSTTVGIRAPSSPGANIGAFYVAQTSGGNTTYPFYVNYGGHLHAVDADITGAITATSLTLGANASVAASKVSGLASVATSGSYSDLGGKPDLTVYYQKGSTIGTTPSAGATGFKVSTAGLLTASNAVIYGTIYASNGKFAGEIEAKSGSIGGWNIYTTSLYKNVTISGSTYQAFISAPASPSSGSAAFGLSKTTGSTTTYPFYVNYSGKLYAQNAEITGKITADNGTIGGFTIDSTAIRSGALSSTSTGAVALSNADFTRTILGVDRTTLRLAIGPRFGVTASGTLIADNVIIKGNIEATSGSFTGEITSTTGTIGGWDITSTQIRKRTATTGGYRAAINAPASVGSSTRAFFIADETGSTTTYPFSVFYNGKLEATNAEISGSITATSGSIGKFTISGNSSNNYLYTGSGSTMAGMGASTTAFWAGSSTAASAPFRVAYDGTLVATNATITGTIHAGTGDIGGWSIYTTSLYKNVTISNILHQAAIAAPSSPTSTSLAFYVRKEKSAGSGTYDYPFTVTYGGKLTATDADISGKITATDGEIGGFTIDSTAVRSGALTSTSSGAVALTNASFTRSIGGTSRTGLRLAIGQYFGVTQTGTVYADSLHSKNANITGGSIQIATDSSTSDKIKLSYDKWTTAMVPLGIQVANTDEGYDANYYAGGFNIFDHNPKKVRVGLTVGGLYFQTSNEKRTITYANDGIHFNKGDNSGTAISTLYGIESGTVTSWSVPANSSATQAITTTMGRTPKIVLVSLTQSANSAIYGSVSLSAYSYTTTGFTVRAFNNTSSSVGVPYRWIAIY